MAGKKTVIAASAAPASKVAVTSTTEVRNSAVPPVAAAKAKEVSREMIAKRAFEISMSGKGGSELENWLKAERELRGR